MSRNERVSWSAPSQPPRLLEGEVHVWRFGLRARAERVDRLRGLLTPDELERADRFLRLEDRVRFVVARGALRVLLGVYVDELPSALRFLYGARGKPELEGACSHHFNLSHSGRIGLFAITICGPVGVDVERVEKRRSLEKIATRFFSASECEALQRLPVAARPEGFYNAWSRKEAYIKATGQGLATPLASFSVSLEPGVPARLLHHRDDPGEVDRWSLAALEVGEGYRAAVMVEGRNLCVHCFDAGPFLLAHETK